MASKKKTPASPSKEEVVPVAKKAAKVKTYEQGVEDGIRQTERILEEFFKQELKTLNGFIKNQMSKANPDFEGLLASRHEELTYEFLLSGLRDGWLLAER